MKKLSVIAVLLTVIGTVAYASSGPLGENSRFKVLAKSDVKYELIYVSDKVSDVRVTIYDEDGRNINSSTVKNATKFKRTFDFSKLKAGTYKVVVKNDEGVAREDIAHLAKKVKLQTFASRLPDSKAIKVHVGDFNPEKPVIIKIYDQNNHTIHRDKLDKINSFSRVYNLSKTDSKYVTVSIENDGDVKSFTHTINK